MTERIFSMPPAELGIALLIIASFAAIASGVIHWLKPRTSREQAVTLAGTCALWPFFGTVSYVLLEDLTTALCLGIIPAVTAWELYRRPKGPENGLE